jgi:predicted phage-related endonuclease
MTNISVSTALDWHALRARHIGSSEVASLFYAWSTPPDGRILYLHMFEEPPEDATCLGCVSRHKTGFRLYHEKAGRMEPDGVEGERVDAGTFLEPALAEWARKKFGPWDLRKVHRYITHPTVAGIGQSRDYEEVDKNYPPVEFKNVDFLIFRDLWQAEGDEILAAPFDAILQLQHQMAGTAAAYGWIVACVGGNNLKRGKIDRHEPTVRKIEEAVASFWQAVETGREPCNLADFETVAELYAAGQKGAAADLTRDREAPELAARYLTLKKTADKVGAEMDAVKARLGRKIGNATAATLQGFKISWPSISRVEKEVPARNQPALTYRGAFTVKETSAVTEASP